MDVGAVTPLKPIYHMETSPRPPPPRFHADAPQLAISTQDTSSVESMYLLRCLFPFLRITISYIAGAFPRGGTHHFNLMTTWSHQQCVPSTSHAGSCCSICGVDRWEQIRLIWKGCLHPFYPLEKRRVPDMRAKVRIHGHSAQSCVVLVWIMTCQQRWSSCGILEVISRAQRLKWRSLEKSTVKNNEATASLDQR